MPRIRIESLGRNDTATKTNFQKLCSERCAAETLKFMLSSYIVMRFSPSLLFAPHSLSYSWKSERQKEKMKKEKNRIDDERRKLKRTTERKNEIGRRKNEEKT